MTLDLEDEVTAALHGWARDVPTGPGDPAGAVALGRRRRRARRRTVAAGFAAGVTIAAGALAFSSSTSNVTTTGSPSIPATVVRVPAAVLGNPAMVVLDPVEPGWSLSYLTVMRRLGERDYVELQLTNADGRQLQVSFYDLGTRRVDASSNPSEIAVRGAIGVLTPYGAGRFRIDWDEQGRTWEADGEPFGSPQAFAALLSGLRVVDEAEWTAWLPAGLADFITAHAEDNITWYPAQGPTTFR